MRLYHLDHSPFAARVRMAIDAKRLDIALIPPPGGVRSAAYRAINPAGLVPALELDDGTLLPESEAIVEYLEDRFPDRPLRPAAPEQRARARLLARIADLHLAAPLKQLYEVAKGTSPPVRAAEILGAVTAALGLIDHHLGGGAYAVGEALSTADCALVPLLFFASRSAPLFPGASPFAPHAKLAADWQGIARDPVAAGVIGELEAAQARRAAARARGEPED